MKQPLLIIALLCVMNFFSWQMFFYFRDDSLKVVFFDVGQGDAIFIRTPQKHYILIDGGPGNVILEKLGEELPFFHNSIDLVILTHPHDDHVIGLIEVLERYNVKDIICTGVLGESAVSLKWNDIIKERGYLEARAGQTVSANNFHITTLYPVESLKDEKVKDLNSISVISRFVFKDKYKFLFMGDASAVQEKEIISFQKYCVEQEGVRCDSFSLKSDVLKVGHHGSRASTSEEFLSVVAPKIAVIMVGEDNSYGHPHSDILERLKDFGIKVMRTDRDGDVIVSF